MILLYRKTKCFSISCTSQGNREATAQRNLPVIVLKLTIVTGITWILGFALAFYSTPYLEYPYVVINSCQGRRFFVLEESITKACVKRSQFHLNWIKICSPKQVHGTIRCNTRQVSPAATKCPKVRYWPRSPVFFLLSHGGRRARVKGKERSLLPSKDDLARAKRAKLSTMGNNTGYLSIQIIWVLTKSSVRPSVSTYAGPFMLADLECLSY